MGLNFPNKPSDSEGLEFEQRDYATNTQMENIANNLIIGEEGKNYKIVTAILRNEGSGWSVLNDSTHSPTNILSVTEDTDKITVTFNFEATKINSFVCCPDETFAAIGLFCGASVSKTSADIKLYKASQIIGGYAFYNGASWKNFGSAYGDGTISFLNGVVTITHSSIYSNYLGSVSSKNQAVVPILTNAGSSSTEITLYDTSGNLLTTESTDMEFYWTRQQYFQHINPTTWNNAGANIWVYGVFEV